ASARDLEEGNLSLTAKAGRAHRRALRRAAEKAYLRRHRKHLERRGKTIAKAVVSCCSACAEVCLNVGIVCGQDSRGAGWFLGGVFDRIVKMTKRRRFVRFLKGMSLCFLFAVIALLLLLYGKWFFTGANWSFGNGSWNIGWNSNAASTSSAATSTAPAATTSKTT
ncbi:hypothetical protein CALCODRAFT_533826, partial [Calocera cornea HHB12733]